MSDDCKTYDEGLEPQRPPDTFPLKAIGTSHPGFGTWVHRAARRTPRKATETIAKFVSGLPLSFDQPWRLEGGSTLSAAGDISTHTQRRRKDLTHARSPETIAQALALAAQERSMDPSAKAVTAVTADPVA